MRSLDRDVERAARAHQHLLRSLDDLGDDQVRQASLLEGWSVGHVLTHMARNADALRNVLEAAGRGEQGQMYPGGMEQRNADIEAGAGRSAAALVADVRTASWALEQCWAGLPGEAWAITGTSPAGPRPAVDVPFLRCREVEVHRLDLGLGYTLEDWPADYVAEDLRRMTMLWASRRPMGMTVVPDAAMRAGDRLRLAWLLGRAEIAGVGPAGVYG